MKATRVRGFLATLAAIGLACGGVLPGFGGSGGPRAVAGREARGTDAGSAPPSWPARPRDFVTEYVSRLGQELAQVALGRPAALRFHVLRGPAATAFSRRSGDVFVSEGMAALCEREDELAAVIAHEIAHFRAGHFAEAVGDKTGSRGIGQPPGTALAPVFELAAEEEADRASLDILAAAGFDPWAALYLAHRVAGQPSQGTYASSWVSRVRALRRALSRFEAGGTRREETFRRVRRVLRLELAHVLEQSGAGPSGP